MTVALTALVVWGLAGVIIAGLLARHGHNFWLLAFMGLGYGPLLVLIWLRAIEGQPTRQVVLRRDSMPTADTANIDGWIDVLVGLDGSPSSVASTKAVLTTLGPAVGRIRLASVIDHERSNSPDLFDVDENRVRFLEGAAIELGFPLAEVALISGQPDKALVEHADVNDFDLLIVAHRRHSVGSGVRGSTVGRLARTADVPVLIGPPT